MVKVLWDALVQVISFTDIEVSSAVTEKIDTRLSRNKGKVATQLLCCKRKNLQAPVHNPFCFFGPELSRLAELESSFPQQVRRNLRRNRFSDSIKLVSQ